VVVAAENTWGSIAAQLGGVHVVVTSIVSDPNADPHEYESNPADARLMASASYVIVNGAGYDNWANHLLAAQPNAGRKVLTVASLVGKREGDNPHFWYDPSYVYKVIAQITADYRNLQPAQSSYFDSRSAAFAEQLAPYRERLAYVQQQFAGTAVASTESILQYLAEYVHLDVVTPVAFMQAVSRRQRSSRIEPGHLHRPDPDQSLSGARLQPADGHAVDHATQGAGGKPEHPGGRCFGDHPATGRIF